MFLTRIAVLQPVFTTMVMLAIMIFGLFSWRSLPIDEYPNVEFPVVAVITSFPGATPETIEADVTDPIEEALSSVAGIDKLTSTSSTGSSLVVIQFTLETNATEAAADVREKVAGLTGRLPDAVDTPRVMRFDPNGQPIISLSVSSDGMSPVRLTHLAEDVISPEITSLAGVGGTTVVGGVDEQVMVEVDPDLLRANGIGLARVTAALRAENLIASSGNVDDSATLRSVQLNAEIKDLDALRSLVIHRAGDRLVKLGDVSNIFQGASEKTGLSFFDGRPSLSIQVNKVEGGNTVAVAHAVHGIVGELNDSGRLGDAKISIVQDNSTNIEASYKTVMATLLEGAILAVAIVYIFLNSWRSTVITGLTLPISILGTLAVISWLGFTLNSMSMLAMTLSIGILIDDAIVVRENITRHLAMGKSHFQAALDGTNEIGLAVLATTLSICAVFMPLAMMDGIIGKFFVEFGVTVSVAVLISLLVSFTLDPMMSSVWHDPDSTPGAKRGPIGRAIAKFEHGFESLAQGYRKLLIICLSWRKLTMLLSCLTFVGAFFLAKNVGFEFMPAKDDGKVTLSIKTPVGSSKDLAALKVEQITTRVADLAEIKSIYATVAAGSRSGANEARITLNLVPLAERELSSAELVPVIRGLVADVPGAEIRISGASSVGGGGGGSPISIKIAARSPVALAEGTKIIGEIIDSTEGTRDMQVSVDASQPVFDYVFLQDLARHMGVNAQSVGDNLRSMVAGVEIGEFEQPSGISIPIVVRLPEESRSDVAGLADLPVAEVGNRALSLGEIARLEMNAGPAKIEREDRSRVVTVSANIEGRLLGDIMADINAKIAERGLPEGVHVSPSGEAEMMADTTANMGMALLMAVVCIYLVLASQFGSFLQPIGIMASLPMAMSGVVLGLWVTGSTFNMNSMIGCIMLMGLVVKNAILLVDNSNQRRREGEDLMTSLIEAGTTRFRPIIMTTLAMIFGMLPLALAWHAGSEQQAPMAHAVIGGLISSTILTLVVVPIMMVWLDRVSNFVKRFFQSAAAH